MNSFTVLKQDVIRYLKGLSELADLHITEEYLNKYLQSPLKKGVLSVGIDSVDLLSSGLGGFLGVNHSESFKPDAFGSSGKLTFRFDVAVPVSSPFQIHSVLDIICGCFFKSGTISFEHIWCEHMLFSEKIAALTVCIKADMSITLVDIQQDMVMNIDSFQLDYCTNETEGNS